MFRVTSATLASKVSGGNARNQAGSPRKKVKQFHVIPGTPVAAVEKLRDQRRRFGQDRYSRLPEYYPGRNVRMDPDTYTLYPTMKGVMTVRASKINPSYRWLDVEPDIQKVYRTRELRSALERRGEASAMVSQNPNYTAELAAFEEPAWRERVMRVPRQTERFKDPNLLVRGLVPDLHPSNRYNYE